MAKEGIAVLRGSGRCRAMARSKAPPRSPISITCSKLPLLWRRQPTARTPIALAGVAADIAEMAEPAKGH
jgi:hypothetical protein